MNAAPLGGLRPGRAAAAQAIALVLGGLIVFTLSRVYSVGRFVGWMQANVVRWEPWSVIAYPFVHASCNLLLLPAGMLVIGCGFFFGIWRGFLLALTGHLLGAAGAFWISRTFGRHLIERHLASRPQWQALDHAIGQDGWKIVCLSQLSPLFPTSLFNYCYGLTRLRFWPCMGWIALGWSPGMFFYTYLGRMGYFGWQLLQNGAQPSAAQYAVGLAGLALTLGVSFALGKIALRLLSQARRDHAQSTR